jgi:hypothetical protein
LASTPVVVVVVEAGMVVADGAMEVEDVAIVVGTAEVDEVSVGSLPADLQADAANASPTTRRAAAVPLPKIRFILLTFLCDSTMTL